ncbi:ankyrin repeat domain-containing protein [Wolbachia endosymbiont of Pentalonia nigronervosa]|jgi:ankyrin repeat protein|uniref:ankyrin repeat domain-containing protein n=1 Tax=Wolbachia endosymbiont of Pentalonia nigronervosa TaxID=1301914 RepID=UPI00165F7652|nr:ankyrin repeat domain-containing protein [Wolbachia endosymbiont of Pentalonia nigronervosa]MBD0391861.1 ankyrin repeat domain-containing protein [Wolbachia endosymbiont of Pentalonia nigronervosa]
MRDINGIDVNDNGNTLLHVAVFKGHKDIVEFLCEQLGININAKNKQGKTPLDIARDLEKQDIVQMLELHIQQNRQVSTEGQPANQLQPKPKREAGSDNNVCEKPRTSSSDQTSSADELSTGLESTNAKQVQGVSKMRN